MSEAERKFAEYKEKIKIIKNLPARRIIPCEPMLPYAAKELVRGVGSVVNDHDGRVVTIPVKTVGKLLGHQGYDFSRIINDIALLYKTSIWAWSEPEILKVGHKHHPNVVAYHHYVNKFTDELEVYFIRLTINEERVKPGNPERNLLHSAAISDIAVYKKGDHFQRTWVIDPDEGSPSPFIDRKLQTFFKLGLS